MWYNYTMEDLVQRALDFATEAHKGQVRKYTGEPYIVHPVEVMEIVRTVTSDPEILSAALLHDVVEDTSFSIDDIWREFGERVARLVSELTDVSGPEDGNRRTRKEIDRKRLARASSDAQTVKLADLINNSDSIIQYDQGFAKIYMQEKLRLMVVLTRGDSTLFNRALKIIEDYHGSR